MSKEVFDRSKLKGAKLSKLREQKAEAEKKDVKLLGGGNSSHTSFHSIDEGRNEFRLLPPHDAEKTGTYVPCRTTTLECDVPEYKDGEPTGSTEMKRKKIFIATQHGNEDLRKLGKDPIELYIKYFNEQASLIDDKDERDSFLAPIKGYRDKNKKWVWGIIPSTSYICYALKDNKVGRLELWDKWTKEMDKIVTLIEEEEDEVLDIDPFSDPDEGYPLVIKKEKNEKNKFEYTIDRVNPKKRQSWEDFCEENRVTDAQLKELYEKDSLHDIYVDCYSLRGFELAINGLQNFEKAWKKDIFENEDFLVELQEIRALLPEDNKEEKEESSDDIDTSNYSKLKCKKILKAYIMENYEDEEDDYTQALEELDLNSLREWAKLAELEEELPNPKLSNDDEVKAPDDTEVEEEENTEENELETVVRGRRRRS